MRRGLNYIGMFLIALILFSCAKNDDYYSLGDIWISLGVTYTENTLGYEYMVQCDNGDTLYPAVDYVTNGKIANQERVLVNYTVLGEINNSEQAFYVKFNDIQKILYKDVVELTDENEDSLGNAPVAITDLWVVNDMLNIEFEYHGDGYTTHLINLSYTQKNEHPLKLEFKHNNMEDKSDYLLKGIVSFNLTPLRMESKNAVDLEISSLNLQNEQQSFTATYKY